MGNWKPTHDEFEEEFGRHKYGFLWWIVAAEKHLVCAGILNESCKGEENLVRWGGKSENGRNLLCGLSIECLMKALHLARNKGAVRLDLEKDERKKVFRTHNLVFLAEVSDCQVSQQDREFLQLLTEIISGAGRYPFSSRLDLASPPGILEERKSPIPRDYDEDAVVSRAYGYDRKISNEFWPLFCELYDKICDEFIALGVSVNARTESLRGDLKPVKHLRRLNQE